MKNIRLLSAFSIQLLLFVLMCSPIYAQDMAGIVTDRYAGLNRIHINPALISNSPNCLDISIITGHVGGQNNYFYVPRGQFSFTDPLRRSSDLYQNRRTYFSYRDNVSHMNGKQYFRLQGPSFQFKLNRHAFAFTNGLRSASSGSKVPVHAVNFVWQGLLYTPQLDILYSESNPFRGSSLSWAEIGLSWATILSSSNHHSLTAGITGKRLWVYHAVDARSDEIEYRVVDNRTIILNNSIAMGHMALPLEYDNLEIRAFEDWVKGKGISFDLGISYSHKYKSGVIRNKRRHHSTWEHAPYAYSLGFSLLDMGAVRINNHTKSIGLENANLIVDNPLWASYENLDELINDLEDQLISGEIINREGDPFTIFLPSAASMQFDYFMVRNFFTQVLWVQDIPLAKNKIARPSYIGIVPRYETPLLTVALPITLYEYTKPRLGISVRFGPLTLGTEQPGGILGVNDFDGMDFYFSLNLGLQNCKWSKPAKYPCSSQWW